MGLKADLGLLMLTGKYVERRRCWIWVRLLITEETVTVRYGCVS